MNDIYYNAAQIWNLDDVANKMWKKLLNNFRRDLQYQDRQTRLYYLLVRTVISLLFNDCFMKPAASKGEWHNKTGVNSYAAQ